MKQITVGNFKGGTGKSTAIFNIGAILAKDFNKKVLMIDLDPQANLSSFFHCPTMDQYVGYDVGYPMGMNILNIFDLKRREIDMHYYGRLFTLEELIYQGQFEQIPNLDILSGHMELNFAAREVQLKNPGYEGVDKTNRILYDYLHSEVNIDKLNSYDYVIVDTNPYVDMLAINGLYGEVTPIVVSDMSLESINGVRMFNQALAVYLDKDPSVEYYKGVILNNVEIYTNSTRNIMSYAQTQFGSTLLSNFIPKTTKVKDSSQKGLPVCLNFKEQEPIYQSLTKVTKELFAKGIL